MKSGFIILLLFGLLSPELRAQFTLSFEPRAGLVETENYVFYNRYGGFDDFYQPRMGLFVGCGYNTFSDWFFELKVGYYPQALEDPRDLTQYGRSVYFMATGTELTYLPSVALAVTKRFTGLKRALTVGLDVEINTLKAHGYDSGRNPGEPFHVEHNYEGKTYFMGTSGLSVGREYQSKNQKVLFRPYINGLVGYYLNGTEPGDQRTGVSIAGVQIGFNVTFLTGDNETPFVR